MVTAAWELDRDTTAYSDDGRFAVVVAPQHAAGHPSWYIYLHGPGGSALVDSCGSQTAAWSRAEHLAEVVGGTGHPWWRFGSPEWKAADERQHRYDQLVQDGHAAGWPYWQVIANAAEKAGMPHAREARHAAGRFA